MTPAVDRELAADSLLLLEDHENDDDDIVPELSYDVQPVQKKVVKKPPKHDFMGQEYTEVYDD